MPKSLLYSNKISVLLNNSIYTVYQKFFVEFSKQYIPRNHYYNCY